MEAFRHHTGIITLYLCWLLSDPEVDVHSVERVDVLDNVGIDRIDPIATDWQYD